MSKPSKTAGLKAGDKVLYDDRELKFEARVIAVTSTTKAEITAYTHVNHLFNPRTIVNTYRKFMIIIPETNLTITFKQNGQTQTITIYDAHEGLLGDTYVYITKMLNYNNFIINES